MKYLPIIAILAIAGCGGATDAASTPTTVTRTLPAPAPVTITKTVTPQSCLEVIHDMVALRGIEVRFDHAVLGYPQLVGDSLHAGLDASAYEINGITARLKGITARIQEATSEVTSLNSINTIHVADCKAGR